MAEPDLTLLTEQERQEGIPGLFTPDELALARAASSMFADQEMMADVYNRLDQRVSPGGELGLLPAVGADDVRFKTYVSEGQDPTMALAGLYSKREGPVNEEGFAVGSRGQYDLPSQALMSKGLEPVRRGEIFLQQVTEPKADRILEVQKQLQPSVMTPELTAIMREDFVSPQATLLHEFTHRAFDSPMYDDFVKWAEKNLDEKDVRAVKFPTLSRANEEFLAEDVGNAARGRKLDDPRNEDRLGRINNAMRMFLTPERQEMYGVRVPVESEPPIEKGIMDYVRSAIGLANGGPPKQMDMFLKLLDVAPGPAGKLAKPVAKGIQSLSKGRKAAYKKPPTREQAQAKIDGRSAAAAGLASGIMDPELLKAKEEGFDIENVRYRGQHGESPDIETKVGSISFGDAEAASLYAQQPNVSSDVAQASKVFPSFLKIENPIINAPDDPFMDFSILSDAIGFDKAKKYFIKHEDDVMNTGNWEENFMDEYDSVADVPDSRLSELYMQSYTILDDPSAVKDMKAAGFDGAIHMGSGETFDQTEYKVFDKSQIRSIFTPGEAVTQTGVASLGPELDKRMAKLKKTLESKKGKPSPDKPVPPEPRRFDDYENPKDRNRR